MLSFNNSFPSIHHAPSHFPVTCPRSIRLSPSACASQPSIKSDITDISSPTTEATSPDPRSGTIASPNVSETKPSFNWRSQWYPLSLLSDLSLKTPTAITLLCTPLVVWRSTDSWSVFYDRCPHRFAALSQGRVTEEGRLECSYHGWQFDSNSSCTRIPQLASDTMIPKTTCATAVPSMERGGMLWAWMGEDDPGEREPQVVDDVRGKEQISTFTRVLPLCFTTLLQNVLDPAHIHFAHHGQIGRRELAKPIPIRMIRGSSMTGFMADYYNGRVLVEFRPPCLVQVVTLEGKSFAYYAIPVKAGVVRTIAIRGMWRKPWFVVPRWIDHLRRNTLVEGDLELMRTQEREMGIIAEENGAGEFAKSWEDFVMPSSSDRLIVEFRRWLREFAPPEEEKWYLGSDGDVKLMGRWDTHTKDCDACRGALGQLKNGMVLAKWIGLGACLGGCFPLDDKTRPIFLCSALLCLGLYAICDSLRARME